MFKHIGWPQHLYLRIYLALLASLAVVAILFAVAWQLNSDPAQGGQHLDALADVAADYLPPASASREIQQTALLRWRLRMRSDLALYAPNGELIAAAGRPLPPPDLAQAATGWLGGRPPVFSLKLPDGRWLVGQRNRPPRRPQMYLPFGLIGALTLIALAVGVGAFPIVRRLTRRLERLQTSVDALGAGQLSTRVAVEGNDEVARLAESFNRSAARIEILVTAQKNLLANASHELRSPLARIRMAVELMKATSQPDMQEELTRNIAELDQLIDEILLASRLDASSDAAPIFEAIDFTALAAEECARVDAQLSAQNVQLPGDAKLLRRLVRNLLENAKRHGDDTAIEVSLSTAPDRTVLLDVCDYGRGVPENERENIFTPFYRLPGASERSGGVGLGLSLVRQIARRHGGEVVYVARSGPGSCFRVSLPQR